MDLRRERERDRRGSRRFQPRVAGEDGAALVEFAFLVPLLILIIFGIIEFGWAFYQQLDVRHGVREGARLAAVAADSTTAALKTETCGRMDTKNNTTVRFEVPSQREDASANTNDIGGAAKVTVTRTVNQLTGSFGFAIANPYTLSSTVWIRLEQKPVWSASLGSDSGALGC
jgi:Flp pilus assembly protein TadG